MDDLAERLRQIERNPSPDLWEEIAARAAERPSTDRRGLRHRVAAGLVAAAVSIAAFAFLILAFRTEPRESTLGPANPVGITILVSSSGPSGDQALLTGTLTSEKGCLAVSGAPGSTVYVVWPAGYSLAEERGDVWLVSDSGNRVAKIGDEVQMGGGITNLAHAQSAASDSIPAACEVGGPDAYWFAGTPELARSSPPVETPTSAAYLPLVFAQFGDGWDVRNFGSVGEGTASKAWASTVTIDDRDLGPRKPAIPVHTIESLPPGEAVIVALATPWHFDPSEGPYPPGSLDPLNLSDATIRGPEAEEPEGDYTIYDVQNGYTTVRVFFGATPNGAELEATQAELTTLEVPPTCPIGYEASASPAEAEPGETVTLTGPMPFQFEDGSYDAEGRTIAIAWWNADEKDWAYLSSFSTRSPSPVASGPIIRLGEGGVGQCSFAIRFTVPDVPPGDYPIVVIQEGPLPSPDGSAPLASLSVRVG